MKRLTSGVLIGLLWAGMVACAGAGYGQKIRLLIDSDANNETDDQHAIAHALLSKDVAAADRPNVMLILADDLGYGDLSCYGATKVTTPNIDRLAHEGRRFTDAHSPSSVCTPTRYNLLTGRYAWRTWARSSCVWANDPLLISGDRLTLGDLFRDQGYRTACIGKWHLGFGSPETPGWDDELGPDYNRALRPGPLQCGFDDFWG